MNHLLLVGVVKEVPVLKESASGVKYANLLIEVQRGFMNNEGYYDTDIISCLLWRSVAENVISQCEKGSLVGVKGRIQSEARTSSEGNIFYNYEVIAERVSFLQALANDTK